MSGKNKILIILHFQWNKTMLGEIIKEKRKRKKNLRPSHLPTLMDS